MPDIGTCEAIRVGREWHSVETVDGFLLESVVLTEQCDRCGSTLDDESQAPFVLETTNVQKPFYYCGKCYIPYEITTVSEDRAVWYTEQDTWV